MTDIKKDSVRLLDAFMSAHELIKLQQEYIRLLKLQHEEQVKKLLSIIRNKNPNYNEA